MMLCRYPVGLGGKRERNIGYPTAYNMTLTVCQRDPLCPLSYCRECKRLFKVGEEITLVTVPLPFRWDKQRKKAKGNVDHTYKVHMECPV